MKTSYCFVLALAAGLSLGAQANAQQHDHNAHHGAAAASPTAAPMSEGVVQKIDKAGGKITIRHGELKNLGMGPMTMAFLVRDRSLLDKSAVGDKVKFVAEMEAGKLAVSRLDVVK